MPPKLRLFLSLFLLLLAFPVLAGAQDADARVKAMATTLRMRATPSPAGTVLAELAGGTPLTVLGRTLDNNWLKAQSDGVEGWVASGYVELSIPLDSLPVLTADGQTTAAQPEAVTAPTVSAPPDGVSASGVAFVQRGVVLRLRQAPSLTAPVLTELAGGTPLTVLGHSADGAWLNVRTDAGEGWVSLAYVTWVSAASPSTVGTAVNVRGVRAIAARGRALGSRYGVFAKIGDSITVSEYSADAIGRGLYTLGGYASLQRVIDTFANASFNSFTHVSAAAYGGWTTMLLLDPAYRDTAVCQELVSPLVCELERIKPSIALIQLGTNDMQYINADQFAANLTTIVDTCIERGVVPVLTTIPYREGFGEAVDAFNAAIRATAARYSIPLWDLKAALDNLPNRGLSGDGIHPSFPPAGYIDSANFASPEAMQAGYVVRNLTMLQTLSQVLAGF